MAITRILIVLLGCTSCFIAGCGRQEITPNAPLPSQACSGLRIQGALKDSLTGSPPTRATAALEMSRTQEAVKTYQFSITAQTAAESDGTFRLCADQSTGGPVSLVIVAEDISGNLYPPVVESVQASRNLGSIQIGGCTLKCLDQQQQTETPSTIRGQVDNASSAVTGIAQPFYALTTVDGSNAIWNLPIPQLDASGTAFNTNVTTCNLNGQATPCNSYHLVVPAQSPSQLSQDRYVQLTRTPAYSVGISPDASYKCATSSLQVFFQNGGSPLIAEPGGNLVAASASLHCD